MITHLYDLFADTDSDSTGRVISGRLRYKKLPADMGWFLCVYILYVWGGFVVQNIVYLSSLYRTRMKPLMWFILHEIQVLIWCILTSFIFLTYWRVIAARILRAIRIAARLEFSFVHSTGIAIRQHKKSLLALNKVQDLLEVLQRNCFKGLVKLYLAATNPRGV